MEELYSETYLRAKPLLKRQVIRVLLMVLAAFFIVVGILFTMILGTPIVFFIMAILAGIVLFLMPTNKIAYEYIFVDGQIDFDRILNGSKRKTMKRVDMEKIEIVAPESSHKLDSYGQLSVIDYSSGMTNDKHWIAMAIGEKGTEKIRFTPDEKMIHMMKMKSPSKIVEY